MSQKDTIFSPPLPTSKIDAINVLTIGVVDKIVLQFDKKWWTSEVMFNAFVWDAKTRAACHNDWVTNIFGASCTMGTTNTLTLWTSGKTAKLVETLPEEEVKTKVMALIRRFMGKEFNITEPTGMLRSTWYSNPYTRGSYSYDNISSPLHPTARADLASPLVDSAGKPRVLFAGEATDNTHFSTVHGATDTGHREAMRLLPQAKL